MPGDESVVVGMMNREIGGMEAQAGGGGKAGRVGVEWVAKNWMCDGRQMQPDLMGAAGDRFDLEARSVSEAREYPPAGLGGAAGVGVDAIPRGPRGIAGDREIDQTVVGFRQAAHQTLVAFPHHACLELSAEVSLGIGIECHEHQARGVAIEAVNDDGRWIGRLHTTGEAIPQVWSTARHGEQSRRLVEDDQPGVMMDDPAGIHIRDHSG